MINAVMVQRLRTRREKKDVNICFVCVFVPAPACVRVCVLARVRACVSIRACVQSRAASEFITDGSGSESVNAARRHETLH